MYSTVHCTDDVNYYQFIWKVLQAINLITNKVDYGFPSEDQVWKGKNTFIKFMPVYWTFLSLGRSKVAIIRKNSFKKQKQTVLYILLSYSSTLPSEWQLHEWLYTGSYWMPESKRPPIKP